MSRRLADGKHPVFAASDRSGREPALEFLAGLQDGERTRMVRVFEKLAAGQRLSREDFRKIRGKIWELKDHQRRMLCFSSAEGWFVTHGFTKKTNASTSESEISRAERIMQEHLSHDASDGRTRTQARPTRETKK